MKKMMMFLMVSVFFLMGGMTEGKAQYLKRTVTLSSGQTFYVSLQAITDGSKIIGLWIQKPGSEAIRSNLGQVSAYALYNVAPEDEGIYYFAVYDAKNGWVYKMEVTLVIRSPGVFVVPDEFEFIQNDRLFAILRKDVLVVEVMAMS